MTTNDILQIPQVPEFSCGNLQNDLHIGFGTDQSKRLNALRWTDEAHTTKRFPDVVDQAIDAYLATFAREDQAYLIAQKSEYVRRRKQKDEQRDALYKEIRKTIETFASLSIFPDKQQTALVLLPVMQKYKIDPDGGIEAQTVATEQWLQEQQANLQLQQAARDLGIYESIQQLQTLNDEVRQLTIDRNDENAQKALAALKNARHESDLAYNALRLIINAMALTATDSADTYQTVIKSMQQTIKYYRQLAEQRRKKNAAARDKKKDDKGGGKDDPTPTPTPTPTPDPEPEPEPEPTPDPEPEPEPEPTPDPDPSGGEDE